MTDPLRFISAPVRALPVFNCVPTADSLARDPKTAGAILLHLNECPYPPSPRVADAISRAAAGANRYGESRPATLAAMLAARTGIPDL